MDDNQYQSSSHYGQQLCSNCDEYPALEGHPTPLCTNCRKGYINYPIPRWIFGFGAIILLVMVFSLYRMPPYLRLAIDLGKAQKAIEAHKYVTAQNILAKIIAAHPNQQEPKAYMFIAACYNMDYDMARKTNDDLKHYLNDFEETKAQTNDAFLYLSVGLNGDSTITDRIIAAATDSVKGLMALVRQMDSTTDDNRVSSKYLIATKLFDMNCYEECKHVLSYVVKENPEHYFALSLLAATNRHLHKFDEAVANCDAILQVNKEDVGAILQKAKIEIARKDFKKARGYLVQAQAIDSTYISTIEVQALLAHFEGRKEEANKFLALLRTKEADDSDKEVSNRTVNIFNGTEVFN